MKRKGSVVCTTTVQEREALPSNAEGKREKFSSNRSARGRFPERDSLASADFAAGHLHSFVPDLHQFLPVSCDGVNRQDISNTWGVEFVLEEVGFQGRGLFRFQAVVERSSWHGDRRGETDCFCEILGISQREFLTVKVADGRMSFHDDSRLVP